MVVIVIAIELKIMVYGLIQELNNLSLLGRVSIDTIISAFTDAV